MTRRNQKATTRQGSSTVLARQQNERRLLQATGLLPNTSHTASRCFASGRGNLRTKELTAPEVSKAARFPSPRPAE